MHLHQLSRTDKSQNTKKMSSQSQRLLKPERMYYISSILNMRTSKKDQRMEEHLFASFEVLNNLKQIEAPEFRFIE